MGKRRNSGFAASRGKHWLAGSGTTQAARGSLAVVQIMPVAEITAARPDCTRCTWVCAGPGVMRVKCISRACPLHGTAECC